MTDLTQAKGKMKMPMRMAYCKQGEDENVDEDGLPQAKEKMELSLRMAYFKQR